MIAIVNYGIGNVEAIYNIYKRLNIPVKHARTAGELEEADRLVLPGVGSFDWAITRLNASGLRETLDRRVRAGCPVLGICVGMQMMADSSEEGVLPGLGWIPGRVRRLPDQEGRLPLPHMGWNDVQPRPEEALFNEMEGPPRFYFLHSFFFDASAPEDVAAEASYGLKFPCAVHKGRIAGVQFHPEKSHRWGIQLLKNFSEV